MFFISLVFLLLAIFGFGFLAAYFYYGQDMK